MIVRISRGRYPTDKHAEIARRLESSAEALVPATEQLPGCLAYFAGADATSSSMVNVSVWDTVAHAQALGSLAPMLALAQEFSALGVEFERPIANYEVCWSIP